MAAGGSPKFGEKIKIGILTASDRAFSGIYNDESGPAIEEFIEKAFKSEWEIERKLVEDEKEKISEAIIDLCKNGCGLVITTGGTGPAIRDVTPEATEEVCDRILPGFGERMRSISLNYVPTAILSRQLAGIRDKTLIVNLPGRPRAINETLSEIFTAIPYCIDLIGGSYIETNDAVCASFRPKSSLQSN